MRWTPMCGASNDWRSRAASEVPREGSARFLHRLREQPRYSYSVGSFVPAIMPPLRLSLALLLAALGGAPLGAWGQPTDSVSHGPDSTASVPPSVDSASVGTSSVARRVAEAFSEGDASRLLTPAANRVEISLFGSRTFYSSAQALYVLREFFRSHAPHRFLVGDVVETQASCFVRGEYEQARRARRFQVYVRLGQPEGDDRWHLREVRIAVSPE